jgi:hypothetical protein
MLSEKNENTDDLREQKKNQKKDEENQETPDISAAIEKKGSYSESPSDKARTHKGPIGIDRDSNSL